MKTKMKIVTLAMVLAITLGAVPAHGNNAKAAETKAKLEILVDDYISCCEAKFGLRGSRSAIIRRAALRSYMKAAYCRHSRDELVKEMFENNIEPKAYKVRLYLNAKFETALQAKK